MNVLFVCKQNAGRSQIAQTLYERRGGTARVVTMRCGDACPVIPGKRYVEWELQDPIGQDEETVRTIRDEIERRVSELPL